MASSSSSSSSSNTNQSASISFYTEPILPIKKKDAVGVPGSKFKTTSINVVLDGLKLNNPEYTFERIMMMVQRDHPDLVNLFDKFHKFTNSVAGRAGKGTDAFWVKGDLQGKRYLVNMVKDALQENLSSIPLSEVPTLPITKDDLSYFIELHGPETTAGVFIKEEVDGEIEKKRKELLIDFARIISRQNKFFKLVLHRSDQVGEWYRYDHERFVDAAWQHIHLVDLKNPMVRVPTDLSVTQWIDQISIRTDVRKISNLLKAGETSVENVTSALLEATEAQFSSAFEDAMNYARQRQPGINVLHRNFIPLITKDITFVSLVANIYLRNISLNKTLGARVSKLDSKTDCMRSIGLFLKTPPPQSMIPNISFVPPLYSSSPFNMFDINSSSLLSSQDFFQKKSILDFMNP